MVVPQTASLFRRQYHNDILHALRSFNGNFLFDAECYFGGGTEVVLLFRTGLRLG